MRSFESIGSALLFALSLSACTGSSGDACQLNSDCNSGLMCCKSSPTAGLQEHGTCAASCTYTATDAGTRDAQVDAASVDATSADDAASAQDAMSVDADTAGPDAGEDASADASADASDDAAEDAAEDAASADAG